MSIGGWMDKENVVYTYNDRLFSLNKEHPAIYDLGEPWGHMFSEICQSQKKEILLDSPYVRYQK